MHKVTVVRGAGQTGGRGGGAGRRLLAQIEKADGRVDGRTGERTDRGQGSAAGKRLLAQIEGTGGPAGCRGSCVAAMITRAGRAAAAGERVCADNTVNYVEFDFYKWSTKN